MRIQYAQHITGLSTAFYVSFFFFSSFLVCILFFLFHKLIYELHLHIHVHFNVTFFSTQHKWGTLYRLPASCQYFFVFNKSILFISHNRRFAVVWINVLQTFWLNELRKRAHLLNKFCSSFKCVMFFISSYLMYFAFYVIYLYSLFLQMNKSLFRKKKHKHIYYKKQPIKLRTSLFGFSANMNPMEIWKINKQIAFMPDPSLCSSLFCGSSMHMAIECLVHLLLVHCCVTAHLHTNRN